MNSKHDIYRLSWPAFTYAIAKMAEKIDHAKVTQIYGVPRGGLVIAVALSHATGLPLTTELRPNIVPNTIVVDDIADSGRTMRRHDRAAQRITWIARYGIDPAVLRVLDMAVGDDRWVLFPWEKRQYAPTDRAKYVAAS